METTRSILAFHLSRLFLLNGFFSPKKFATPYTTRIWIIEVPKEIRDHELRSRKAASLWADNENGMMGSYYWNSEAVRVVDYRQETGTCILSKSQNLPRHAVFNWNGALFHATCAMPPYLNEIFADSWIGNYGPEAGRPDYTTQPSWMFSIRICFWLNRSDSRLMCQTYINLTVNNDTQSQLQWWDFYQLLHKFRKWITWFIWEVGGHVQQQWHWIETAWVELQYNMMYGVIPVWTLNISESQMEPICCSCPVQSQAYLLQPFQCRWVVFWCSLVWFCWSKRRAIRYSAASKSCPVSCTQQWGFSIPVLAETDQDHVFSKTTMKQSHALYSVSLKCTF